MSAGYASRLKEYPNKGVCGLPERRDTKRALAWKVAQLADDLSMLGGVRSNNANNNKKKKKKRVVVLTGAGVSTSAGIPDFRGPQGVWTLEKANTENKKRKRETSSKMDFGNAQPTYTHRAITKLVNDGIVDYCITQNVDGLHQRSGLSRAKLSVLHGCVFTEKCEQCGTEHFRDYDIGGMSFQKTGRKCAQCQQGDLRDTLLDWEDELPQDDFERSTLECQHADLVLCLGTSLRIEPAGSLPKLAKKFVIVNLQETPFDKEASLIIRGPVDDVMQSLMQQLGYDKDWDTSATPPTIERFWPPLDADQPKDDREEKAKIIDEANAASTTQAPAASVAYSDVEILDYNKQL